jgi:mono/diheme cytochrome c family protein
MRILGAGLILFLFGSAPAMAQNVEAGHRLATMWCSACHRVETRVVGPISDTPPSFVAVARMSSTTRMSLNVFLSTPHFAMPDISLSRKEIADVSAYILSLRPAEQQN